jgi:hypothetical protein
VVVAVKIPGYNTLRIESATIVQVPVEGFVLLVDLYHAYVKLLPGPGLVIFVSWPAAEPEQIVSFAPIVPPDIPPHLNDCRNKYKSGSLFCMSVSSYVGVLNQPGTVGVGSNT